MNLSAPRIFFGIEKGHDRRIIDYAKINSSNPGMAWELTRAACDSLKFTCNLVLLNSSNKMTWNNGSQGGLFGEIADGSLDASLPLYLYSKKREAFFDFTRNAECIPFYFVTRKFDAEPSISIKSIIRSLKWEVWLFILLSILMLSILFWMNQFRLVPHWSKQFANCCSILLQVSLFLIRKSLPFEISRSFQKISLLIWGLCSILLTTSYTSGLISSMVKVDVNPPFNDFHSLVRCLKVKECRMVFTESGWFEDYIADPSLEIHSLHETLKDNSPVFVQSLMNVIETITKTPQVFLVTELVSVLDLNKLETCDLYMVQYPVTMHYLFHKNHSQFERFEERLKWVKQSRLIEHLVRKYLGVEDICDSEIVKPVPLRFMASAIAAWTAGLVFSVISLICELAF